METSLHAQSCAPVSVCHGYSGSRSREGFGGGVYGEPRPLLQFQVATTNLQRQRLRDDAPRCYDTAENQAQQPMACRPSDTLTRMRETQGRFHSNHNPKEYRPDVLLNARAVCSRANPPRFGAAPPRKRPGTLFLPKSAGYGWAAVARLCWDTSISLHSSDAAHFHLALPLMGTPEPFQYELAAEPRLCPATGLQCSGLRSSVRKQARSAPRFASSPRGEKNRKGLN
ncbi:hypothetical protein SKAU_G00256770 [Synaphobranchus kaupii]|uniref:Uncharacterized protein n=1 Tax=Synaphobranchus kaupii TaxID=118154 RepID=A0A9Q1F3W8_SYNKA|nr:hypothetical protein SKAU_G00256770 [Synaphobranchus kaupii]